MISKQYSAFAVSIDTRDEQMIEAAERRKAERRHAVAAMLYYLAPLADLNWSVSPAISSDSRIHKSAKSKFR